MRLKKYKYHKTTLTAEPHIKIFKFSHDNTDLLNFFLPDSGSSRCDQWIHEHGGDVVTKVNLGVLGNRLILSQLQELLGQFFLCVEKDNYVHDQYMYALKWNIHVKRVNFSTQLINECKKKISK